MTISISKPAGSSHFLRFTGTIPTTQEATTGYGEFDSPFVAGVNTVRFMLGLAASYTQPAGSSGPTDPAYRLQPSAYDGVPTQTLVNKTWTQNTRVTAISKDGNTSLIELNATAWELDATTGIPVLVLDITASAEAPEVDIQVEVRHSHVR
jgi:hypothetical protein